MTKVAARGKKQEVTPAREIVKVIRDRATKEAVVTTRRHPVMKVAAKTVFLLSDHRERGSGRSECRIEWSRYADHTCSLPAKPA